MHVSLFDTHHVMRSRPNVISVNDARSYHAPSFFTSGDGIISEFLCILTFSFLALQVVSIVLIRCFDTWFSFFVKNIQSLVFALKILQKSKRAFLKSTVDREPVLR